MTAPAARYVLTTDQLRQLERAWGSRLPETFHLDWSDDVPHDERQRRDAQAREALLAAGVLVPASSGERDEATTVKVEPHVRRFWDVLHHPTTVVTVQAWTTDRQWVEQVWCDAWWGLALRRSRLPSREPPPPAPPTPAPPSSVPQDGTGDAPWADEDAVSLVLAQPGLVLASPLDLLDRLRDPDERTATSAPVVLSVAQSVALVAACRPERRRDVARSQIAHEMLHQVGADPSGDLFASLALGVEAGFEVTVTTPVSPVGQHGLYVRTQGLWVRLSAHVDSVVSQVAAGGRPDGPTLADASTVRLAPTTTGGITADYLTALAAHQQTTDHRRGGTR